MVLSLVCHISRAKQRHWFCLLALGCALLAAFQTMAAYNQSTLAILESLLLDELSYTSTLSISNSTVPQPSGTTQSESTATNASVTTTHSDLSSSVPANSTSSTASSPANNKTLSESSEPSESDLYSCYNGSATLTFPHTVPHFLLAGAQKGGTSALYSLLKKHPNVVASMRFEPHYFDYRGKIPPTMRGVQRMTPEKVCQFRQAYLEYFPTEQVETSQAAANNKTLLVFEKTPDYLPHPHIPPAIAVICPWKPQIVLSLRHPVDRVYSFFKMVSNYRHSKLTTFEAYVDREMKTLRSNGFTQAPTFAEWNATYDENSTETVETSYFSLPENLTLEQRNAMPHRLFGNKFFYGAYAQQIRHWMKHFPLDGEKPLLKIVSYDDFNANQSAVFAEILDFLGAPPHEFSDAVLQANLSPNAAQQKRKKDAYHKTMSPRIRQYLLRFYKPYNDELADLLGEKWRGIWET